MKQEKEEVDVPSQQSIKVLMKTRPKKMTSTQRQRMIYKV